MTIQQDIGTSPFSDSVNKTITSTMADETIASFENVNLYSTVLPKNIDIFSSLNASVVNFENNVIMEQVKGVLLCLYLKLKNRNRQKAIENYLPKIHLVQQDDKTALLEWNFRDFRIGFSLDSNKDESSYFIVSQDKDCNVFKTNAYKLDADLSRPIDRIIEYVLENT